MAHRGRKPVDQLAARRKPSGQGAAWAAIRSLTAEGVALTIAAIHGRCAGTPDGTIPPSRDPAKTQNDIIDSIIAVQTAGGLVAEEGDVTQLRGAILALIAANGFAIPDLPDHAGAAADADELAIVAGGVHQRIAVSELFEGRATVDQVARDQIALTNHRLMIATAVSTSALVQGKQWELTTDEWGATSTNEGHVVGPPGYYRNVGSSGQLGAAATSISGGDDASAGESQAQAYDGNLSTLWRSLQSGAAAYNTAYLGQDFGAGNLKNITQVYFNQGFSGNPAHGATDIALQSADNIAGPWTTRASVAGQSQYQSWVTINSAYGGYHWYWRVTPTAGLQLSWRIQELQMTGVGQALDMTLIPPSPVSLSAAPAYADLIFLWRDEDGSSVLGTDITVELSRDGGTTWTVATLTNLAAYDGTYSDIRARANLSGQPAGTSLTCRVKTLNTKAQRVATPALYAE